MEETGFYVFIDNLARPQIICNFNHGILEGVRGVCGDDEQIIDSDYVDVAKAFLDSQNEFSRAKSWKYQVEWYARLYTYFNLFEKHCYNQIDVEQLIDDMAYNGYNLHYKNCMNEPDKKFYPKIKRELIKQPMLKPMIAKFLGCKPSEVYVGRYYGNGVNHKYIIGDLHSTYLDKRCGIETVFGSIDIMGYQGEFEKFGQIESTLDFKIEGWKTGVNVFKDMFSWDSNTIKEIDECDDQRC